MARRNDQVFQLSLTEIAFTITFLLLLLLAFVVLREQRGRLAAEAALARLHGPAAADTATDPTAVRDEILRERAAAGPAADERTLTALVEARVERERLRRAVADLDARLSALGEVQAASASALAADGGASATAPADARAATLGAPSPAASTSPETADLRGQVAFLRQRLGTHGGRDFPPCWADDAGKVEFLFAVDLTPAGIVVSPAWPPRRAAAAQALPGLQDVVGGPWTADDFVRRTRPLLDDSRRRVPECRHYVELKSSIADAVQSDRARLLVESVFYKAEVRR